MEAADEDNTNLCVYMGVIIMSKTEWQHVSEFQFRVLENCRFNYTDNKLGRPHSFSPVCQLAIMQLELRALATNRGVVYGHRAVGSPGQITK